MRAIRAIPGLPDSAERADVLEPAGDASLVRVRSELVGLCGTDRELLHRRPIEGSPLTVGHESLGVVLAAPADCGFEPGDRVVGVIRVHCGNECSACDSQRSDLCPARPLLERGIYGLDGYGSDEWTSHPDRLVRVSREARRHLVLTEPLSSVIKAVRRLLAAIDRSEIRGRGRVVVMGAGTIGLLAAWQLSDTFDEVIVVDPRPRVPGGGFVSAMTGREVLPDLTGIGSVDAAVDCSGSVAAVEAAIDALAVGGVLVLEGIPDADADSLAAVSIRAAIFKDLTVIGTVNASVQDYRAAATALEQGPAHLLDALITREIGPEDWPSWAVDGPSEGDIKVVVRFSP